jgi:hypothetical protein
MHALVGATATLSVFPTRGQAPQQHELITSLVVMLVIGPCHSSKQQLRLLTRRGQALLACITAQASLSAV